MRNGIRPALIGLAAILAIGSGGSADVLRIGGTGSAIETINHLATRFAGSSEVEMQLPAGEKALRETDGLPGGR